MTICKVVFGFILLGASITAAVADDAARVGVPHAPGFTSEAAREQANEAKREAQAKERQEGAAARRAAQQVQREADTPKDVWARTVRARVADTLMPVLARGRAQRFGVAFKVSEAGDVFNVKIDGESRLARRAEAKLLATRMPAPPDQHDHSITVGVTIH